MNKATSDEFEGHELDTSKWLVQGTDGEYRSRFIGRAPSQFSTNNVRVEDGKLKLQTRWEPGFPFSDKPDADGELVGKVTKAELGDRWILKHPLSVWVDSETFPWHGLPRKEDLPVDFDIEYIRVWQRK